MMIGTITLKNETKTGEFNHSGKLHGRGMVEKMEENGTKTIQIGNYEKGVYVSPNPSINDPDTFRKDINDRTGKRLYTAAKENILKEQVMKINKINE
jgi:hypothetical protein